MSASLVGSEMCIRDSFRHDVTGTACNFRSMAAVGMGAASGDVPSTPPTVSYTHLTLPTICSV
eukprot:14026967-Alexandrium_andersonii.AAC.1